MKKNVMMLIALAILILFVGIQAYQIQGLASTVAGEATGDEVKSQGQSSPTASGGSGGAVPKSLKDLPTMVGGC